jgi:hypothetical protein
MILRSGRQSMDSAMQILNTCHKTNKQNKGEPSSMKRGLPLQLEEQRASQRANKGL